MVVVNRRWDQRLGDEVYRNVLIPWSDEFFVSFEGVISLFSNHDVIIAIPFERYLYRSASDLEVVKPNEGIFRGTGDGNCSFDAASKQHCEDYTEIFLQIKHVSSLL